MLKREITYADFDDQPVTKTVYFNLSESELFDMEFEQKEGMAERLQRIIKAEDKHLIAAEFKKLLLASYGVREGDQFVKNEEVRTAFLQTGAYNKIFMDIISDDTFAAEFINGIIPKGLQDQDKPTGPPPTPSTALVPPPPPA